MLLINRFFYTLAVLFLASACTMNFKTNKQKKYELYPSGNAHIFYPMEQYSGTVFFEDGSSVYIPFSYSYSRDWGGAGGSHVLNNDNLFALPDSIAIGWYSIVENKFYEVRSPLPKERIKELLDMIDPETKKPIHSDIIAGMAPYGQLAIWISGATRSDGLCTTAVAWFQGKESSIDFLDYIPDSKQTSEEYCEEALRNDEQAYDNFQKNGLPDKELFNNYMAKFEYRIVPMFENEEIEFKVPDVWYYNGDVSPVDRMSYNRHQPKGKPYRINIGWSDGKDNYDGFFWTDEKKIIDTFDQFFKQQGQKEGDFVVYIADSFKDFKFSLENENVKVEIPMEEMEIMIFKNRFEYFRHNYFRPEGGWRH